MKDIVLYKYKNFAVADVSIENLDSIPVGPDEIINSRMIYVYTGVLDIVQTKEQVGSEIPSASLASGTLNDPDAIYGTNRDSAYVYTRGSLAEWLCFTGPIPFTGTLVVFNGVYTVPANTGVFVVMGTIDANDAGAIIPAARLNYLRPRTYDYEISGTANVILLNFQ